MLHGGPGAHHDYLLPQFDELSTGRSLHFYDQRGGGRSPVDRHTPVDWHAHVADLDTLLDEWGFQAATLLGYSWGALLAMLYAIEHPDRVERLALVSPAPATAAGRRVFEARFTERMRSKTVVDARLALTQSGLRDRDPAAYRQRAFELSVAGYFHDFENARDLTPFRVTQRTQRSVWSSLGEYDIRGALADLDVPSRVFHGTHDPIPVQLAAEVAALLRGELVRFERSGHCPYVEEPKRFTRVVDDWLAARP